MYLYHLARDDAHLQEVHDTCAGGQRLCGGCKKEAVGLLVEKLADIDERRSATEHLVGEIVAVD